MAKGKSKEPELEVHAKLKNAGDVKDWKKEFKSEKKKGNSEGGGSAIYFVGFVGSLVYWMQAAAGFGAVLTGILKALVWPAYVVYKLLESFYGVVN